MNVKHAKPEASRYELEITMEYMKEEGYARYEISKKVEYTDIIDDEYEMAFNVFGFHPHHIENIKFYIVEKKRVLSVTKECAEDAIMILDKIQQ